ncbi:HK97 gp10 family phage protein [Ilumatobacter sp.]|uniref:HK97 gp10 family phage protein n=1 Tax=Ilumatobacter sp. TaxID=1967498 RepID=UPI0037515ED1
MTKPSIEVEGARQLKRALRQIEGGTSDLKEIHAKAAKIVEDAAVPLVPRRTGRLAASVRSSGIASGGVVRAGFAKVPYAGPIHFGWPKRNISPQPFLYDALDQRRGEVIGVYEDNVKKLIKKNNLD